MTALSFIVKGIGGAASLQSASHGAGRKMSRWQAMKMATARAFKDELEKHGVKLISSGLDGPQFAYKDIH